MNSKYIGLLSVVQDPNVRAALAEMAKDLDELKNAQRPKIHAIGKSMETIDRMRIKDGPWAHKIAD